jgi:UDP-GlcNAc:undecaprenyl-phosphate/decaprenyl-phosphate GlcNAc-1-phosphate transferase
MRHSRLTSIPNQSVISAFVVTLLIAVSTLAIIRPLPAHYPYLFIEAPEDVSFIVLLEQREPLVQCEAAIAKLAHSIVTSCPGCRIAQLQCLTKLDTAERDMLAGAPLDTPSAIIPGGVVVYAAPSVATAMKVCRETAQLSIAARAKVTCFPPNTTRSIFIDNRKINSESILWAALALIVACLTAWFTCWLIIRYEYLHAHFSHDAIDTGPQKFHTTPTPRIGGVALATGLIAASAVILLFEPRFKFNIVDFGFLLIAGAPVFFGGIAEDVTKRVNVLPRLLVTMLGGGLCTLFLGATLNRLDIPGIDTAFLSLPFAVAFTIFAVAGVTNAINIIDGYHGLAGGFAVIVLLAMAFVSAQVGDGFIFTTALILIGALAGFLVWNWPGGNVFLGDGGAYLIGFILAELSVLLVVRNPQVSPWLPMLLLSYPVFETIFSIYRKKIVWRVSPGRPGGRHLHMLVYKNLIVPKFGSDSAQKRRNTNSLVAPYILWAPLACALFAISFWQSSSMLMIGVGLVCFLYIFFYLRIASMSKPVTVARDQSLHPLQTPAALVAKRPRNSP